MNYGIQGIHKQQLALNARGKKWARKIILIIIELTLAAMISIAVIGAAFGIGMFKSILSTAPDITTLTVTPTGQSTFVYDAEGNQIAKLVAANSNRIPIGYNQISPTLIQAFVAIEDERFYTHNGIDIQGILGAGLSAFRKGSLGRGASTITQQLLKNNVFTDWMSEENDVQKIKRKVQEQYLAVQLEKVMSKEDILTNYLNTINLGHSTLGVQAACLRYFGKNASDLTLSECAVIAGITQNPSRYDPIIYPENNKKRMVDVLDKMKEMGYITQEEEDAAIADNVYSRINETNEALKETGGITSYFVDALTEQLMDDFEKAGYNKDQTYALLYSGGLKIYSTMDPQIQAICDEEFANEENYPENTKWLLNYRLTVLKADGTQENHSNEMVRSYFRQSNANFNMLFKNTEAAQEAIEKYQEAVLEEGDSVFAESISITPQPQVSFTVEEQSTGHIVAMIGGRGTKEGNRTFNRATQSTRQPGSCFKVLSAFAPAIDSCGMTLATVFNDAPFNYRNGTPVSNWYNTKDEAVYLGLCSIRYGIYWSLNVVAVKTITQITPELGFNYLLNFGFTSLEEAKVIGDQVFTDIGQPLALGGITNGIYNYELNAAYASIANGGVYIEPKMYTKVVDSEGRVLLDTSNPVTRQTVSAETAWLLTDAMKDCVTIGTGTRARLKNMSTAGKTGTTSDGRDVWFAGYTPYYTATGWAGYDNNETMNDFEQRIPQIMFKAVMTRVHEDKELPDIGFEMPASIIKCAVCSKSGKLPVAGLCDACIREEYFLKGTEPTEPCNVHYVGPVCAFDNLPATENCPFKYEGVIEVPPVEDPSLWEGSSVISSDLDPLSGGIVSTPNTTGHCQHDESFYAREDWYTVWLQQLEEYKQRTGTAWYVAPDDDDEDEEEE